MGSKDKINIRMYSLKEKCLKIYSRAKESTKKFMYKHIISIYVICVLLIVLFFNVSARNTKIYELELQVKELQTENEFLKNNINIKEENINE